MAICQFTEIGILQTEKSHSLTETSQTTYSSFQKFRFGRKLFLIKDRPLSEKLTMNFLFKLNNNPEQFEHI